MAKIKPDDRNRVDQLRVDLRAVRRDLGSISPKVSIHAKLRERESKLARELRALGAVV